VVSYGGYSTNLPLEDLIDGKAWIAFRYGGEELEAEHGGPARLLVPHLYLWKSAKWVCGIQLLDTDEPGFWESLGYHNYGDPGRSSGSGATEPWPGRPPPRRTVAGPSGS
jgi:DMSO/TMAO reductase YedYZ molybdopterin-dependent catalytic subunit